MIGFDLWLIVLFLEVEERDGLEAEARGLGRAEKALPLFWDFELLLFTIFFSHSAIGN